MRVAALRHRGFRNLAPAELQIEDGITLVWGPNGAGKTNLIEAVYLALAGRSPRTRRDRELIAFGEELARAEVEIADGDQRRSFVCAVVAGDGRTHRVDGTTAQPSDRERRPPLAVFLPDRLVLVKGPPAARRAHFDRLVAALWPARAEARRAYGRALAQRNALLGRVRRGESPPSAIDTWDAELATAATELMTTRDAAVERLRAPFARAGSELGLPGGAEVEYRPRVKDADALGGELAARREADLARGYTGYGPHLDEIEIALGRRSVRRYASQGEQRGALLALLFAERDALLEEHRTPPLMLLDDVTSELDPERRERLCERLATGGGQALITATEPGQLPDEAARTEVALRGGCAIGPARSAAAA